MTDLKYPMVDVLTDAMMSLTYLNILTVWYLLLLTAPWLFMQAWMKAFEGERASRPIRPELFNRVKWSSRACTIDPGSPARMVSATSRSLHGPTTRAPPAPLAKGAKSPSAVDHLLACSAAPEKAAPQLLTAGDPLVRDVVIFCMTF